MKVLMLPHLYHFRSEESGIKRVVEAYFKYLPQFDIELVLPDATDYDLRAVHAGMTGADNEICHLHGLYWTGDYDAAAWEYESNQRITEAVRNAKEVTVPSAWVQEVFQRDMRFSPTVIPHGIDWQDWQHNEPCEKYVLWSKNRYSDVCKPDALDKLSLRFPNIQFIGTFGHQRPNAKIFNTVINHQEMKLLLRRAGVYLSSTKETFGIQTLEAMAAGVPVLGWRYGGNCDLVSHGVNGYLAEPGNYDDLAEGLVYCLKHRDVLGANGRELAKGWTWEAACEKVAGVYRLALQEEPATVSVVIPVYNKTVEQVDRAIASVLVQTHRADEIIVVNDGSQDNGQIADLIEAEYGGLVEYIYQDNQGVANARNNGIAVSHSKFVCCLDADDWLEPSFLETCAKALEGDRSLGIAYTGLRWHNHTDGSSAISDWPPDWNYDNQLKKQNQIPTCCVFRRSMWERLGGYRQRYAPGGAGAEDAEYWTRAGAYGWAAKKVTNEPLFNYSLGGSVSSNPDYVEPNWLSWHPWVTDGLHPFASYATPKKLSHPVRQYDQPVVSVIIPVGPGHEKDVINALDSLEAQTFRKWEAVVVWDSPSGVEITGGIKTMADVYVSGDMINIFKAYPYVTWQPTSGKRGAGYSRNKGVSLARASFLLFLDADDTLHPQALERMLEAWGQTGQGVYTDYVGQAFIEKEFAARLDKEQRLLSYNPKDGEAIIGYQAADFDCARALRQPESDRPYIWNLITTLIPKAWHDEIGGFDETMETWEDWDYWLRIARTGHCFYHLPEQLVRYRFYTGQRRGKAAGDTIEGRQTAQAMIEYLKDKYDSGHKVMGCGCKGKSNGTGAAQQAVMTSQSMRQSWPEASGESQAATVNDSDFIKAKYTGRRGNHHVIGAFEFTQNPGLPSVQISNNPPRWKLRYGYISEGAIVPVYKEDVRLMVGKWQPVIEVKAPKVEIKATPEPALIGQTIGIADYSPAQLAEWNMPTTTSVPSTPTFDLQTLPGVNAQVARSLQEAGLTTPAAIREAGFDKLIALKGIAEARARAILRAVENAT